MGVDRSVYGKSTDRRGGVVTANRGSTAEGTAPSARGQPPESVSERAWFLAQFKPNCQHIAERNLQRQHFPVFLPQQMVTRRQRGRFVEALQPLFPGYLFVSFDPASGGWRKINATYGITRLVAFGSDPAPVPPALVAELMARCDGEGQLQPPTAFAPGDSVRVTKGPFADFVARIEKLDSQERVWLLLDILGRPTRVSAQLDALQGV